MSSAYTDLIKTAVATDDDNLAALIEEFMRGQYSTLDHLTRAQFTRAAREAAQDAYIWACSETNPETLAREFQGVSLSTYCQTLGLAVPASLFVPA